VRSIEIVLSRSDLTSLQEARGVGSMKQNSAFPETVEHKSCTATIYHQQHRRGERFEVRY